MTQRRPGLPVDGESHGSATVRRWRPWAGDERVWHTGPTAVGVLVAEAVGAKSVPADREVTPNATGATRA